MDSIKRVNSSESGVYVRANVGGAEVLRKVEEEEEEEVPGVVARVVGVEDLLLRAIMVQWRLF